MKILFRAPFSNRSGYGEACHLYLMSLRAAGVPFEIQPVVDADTEDLPERYRPLLDHLRQNDSPNDYTHVIVHAIPILAEGLLDELSESCQKKILLTTWETDKLHTAVPPRLNENFDLIIVPCRFNADLFIASGVDPKKIVIVPHAYDETAWGDMRDFKNKDYAPRQFNEKLDDFAVDEADKARIHRPYTFYNIGVWTTRKNPLGPITAYIAEFGPDEPVKFVHVTHAYYKQEILELLKAGSVTNPPKLEIRGPSGYLSDEEMRQLHRECDCYVTLTRGEGFGLGAFEATLAGNPVIATNWSGQLQFLRDYPGFRPVPYFLTPCLVPPEVKGNEFDIKARNALHDAVQHAHNQGLLEIRTVLGPATKICFDQNWAEPDIMECRRFMREAFEKRDRMDYRAGFYDWILKDQYSYESVGRQLRRVLEGV